MRVRLSFLATTLTLIWTILLSRQRRITATTLNCIIFTVRFRLLMSPRA